MNKYRDPAKNQALLELIIDEQPSLNTEEIQKWIESLLYFEVIQLLGMPKVERTLLFQDFYNKNYVYRLLREIFDDSSIGSSFKGLVYKKNPFLSMIEPDPDKK
jgi:hypothetical protein